MRKIIVMASLCLGTLPCMAQEKVMNIHKADGSVSQTRVADLKQISFLTIDEGGEGLLVKTLDGQTTSILFEANPVVTFADGKLMVKPSQEDAVEFEIADIAEIQFGDVSDASSIRGTEGFSCVLQENGVLLRGIPKGTKPQVCTLDGRSLPTPSVQGDELRLSRAALGSGVFIVKVGTFSAKIMIKD